MKHGGDILSYKNLFDGEITDFSSNINPLGPPEGLKKFLNEAFEFLNVYPDIKYRNLKKSIAIYLGCDEEEVVVGNGAVEIIANIIMIFKRVVVFTPCFSEYTKRGEVLGKDIVELSLDDEFKVNLLKLESILRSGDVLILGNPNNPTGKRIDFNTLEKIHEICLKKDVFLLLDEAFFEFCSDDYDSISVFKNSKNVCVIRAATKFFGLPGIRLGYAFSNREFVRKFEEILPPWSVNSYAEAAGRYIFNQHDYIEKSKRYISNERSYLIGELERFENIRVFRSDTNFLLIQLLSTDEDYIFYRLINKGILIRKGSSFHGLNKNFIRVAVKDHNSNVRLINCLKECL